MTQAKWAMTLRGYWLLVWHELNVYSIYPVSHTRSCHLSYPAAMGEAPILPTIVLLVWQIVSALCLPQASFWYLLGKAIGHPSRRPQLYHIELTLVRPCRHHSIDDQVSHSSPIEILFAIDFPQPIFNFVPAGSILFKPCFSEHTCQEIPPPLRCPSFGTQTNREWRIVGGIKASDPMCDNEEHTCGIFPPLLVSAQLLQPETCHGQSRCMPGRRYQRLS